MMLCDSCCAEAECQKCSSCEKASYCSRECQRRDWPQHRQRCPPVRPGQAGMRATRNLKAGTVLTSELPLLVYYVDHEEPLDTITSFKKAFQKLDAKAKKKFLSLNVNEKDSGMFDWFKKYVAGMNIEFDDETIEAYRVAKNHNISLADDNANLCRPYDDVEGKTPAAVYEQLSLFRHSCSPNAVYDRQEGDVTRKEVRSIVDIKKGEEVFVCFLDCQELSLGSRVERRRALEFKWSFSCMCSECSLEGEELEGNEGKRKRLRKVVKQVCRSRLNSREAVRKQMPVYLEMLRLVQELGLRLEYPWVFLNCAFISEAALKYGLAVPPQAVTREQALSVAKVHGGRALKSFRDAFKE